MVSSAQPGKLVDSRQIRTTALLVRRPLWERLYVWPFVVLYGGWGGAWLYLTRINPDVLRGWLAALPRHDMRFPWLSLGFWIKYEEFLLIPLGLLLVAHFLTVMSCYWSVPVRAYITCRRVRQVAKAELIMIVPVEHRGRAELCPLVHGDGKSVLTLFVHQQRKFYWNADRQLFVKPSYPDALSMGDYLTSGGLDAVAVTRQREQFGRNEFDLPVPTFMSLFRDHAVAPFFVFQIFCVALWCLDEYWYYSLFTLCMLVVFESTVVQQRLKTMEEFRGMSIPPIDVHVRRDGQWTAVKSNEILPGDLCAIPFSDKVDGDGLTVPCDLILLAGSCIVNEAMISGESTPLLKESIADADAKDQLDIADADRHHVLFGGTKIVQIHGRLEGGGEGAVAPPAGETSPVIVGYAARTGFGTLQGKLVRTMIYSSEHVSANNTEAFLFIGFLLIFALAAAGYVLVKGVEDEGRSRYKLLLDCVLIITAVVPPELPMELSLAVNNSLQELSKYAIFCMEPFRIPLAGKLDVCCFDKTGTLTAENLIVDGLAGCDAGDVARVETDLKQIVQSETGRLAVRVMSVCHSLFLVRDGQVAGDPMEKATLDFINWDLTVSDTVRAKSAATGASLKIVHRFPFSSALKRMSCIARTGGGELFVGAKGAPEVLREMMVAVPEWYEPVFTALAQSGARVLALGHRLLRPEEGRLGPFKHAQRDLFERKLVFCGFLVFRCPLKPDSKGALRLLRESSHQVVMITGDNALTAIHTARQLDMIAKDRTVLLFDAEDREDGAIVRVVDAADCNRSIDWLDAGLAGSASPATTLATLQKRQATLCFTGNGFDALSHQNPALSLALLPQTAIFARTSPTQKENILARLKSPPLSLHTLMCGDGTNDVGALKQAHIGVALLDGRPEDLNKILKEMRDAAIRKQQRVVLEAKRRWEAKFQGGVADGDAPASAVEKMLQSLEDADANATTSVKLGDASVAAPFTSKISTAHAVCNLIRQGRCTLVTTIQMYKILALNSLITAYSLSVLHLSGVRYGDFQVTITGMLLSACFLFLTRGKPLREMSPARPQSNIFNVYLLTSVLLQFALHVSTLIYVTVSARRFEIPWSVTGKTVFVPGLMNTAVYLLGLLMQVSTFVVNYQGRPFRESLLENKPLRNALGIVGAIGMVAALELHPEFNAWLELVPMPPRFRTQLVGAILVDFFGCFVIELAAHRLFFSNRPRLVKLL